MYRYNNNQHGCNCNNMPNLDDEMNIIEDSTPCSNLCQMHEQNCDCGFEMDNDWGFPTNPMYAQSYVPIQQMKKVFTPEVGLKMGTIFPELVSPYRPCQSIEEIEYIRNTNQPGEGSNR